MVKRVPPRPTKAELAILSVLWEHGPSTVRQVHEELRRSQPTGYTTTLKQMQVMAEKGLLSRGEAGRAHVYRPTRTEERTLRAVTRDLLQRAYRGSAEKLVLHALQAKKVSSDELAKIRQLLDELENR